MKPLVLPGNPKGCTQTRKIVTKRRSSWPHYYGQNYTPNPQYAPKSLGIDPELQICHEIICEAFVFEKNRTAWIPVSGVERYGAPKLWSGVLHGVMQGGAIMDSQHQICFEFQARSWGWGLGWRERRNKGKLGVN